MGEAGREKAWPGRCASSQCSMKDLSCTYRCGNEAGVEVTSRCGDSYFLHIYVLKRGLCAPQEQESTRRQSESGDGSRNKGHNTEKKPGHERDLTEKP